MVNLTSFLVEEEEKVPRESVNNLNSKFYGFNVRWKSTEENCLKLLKCVRIGNSMEYQDTLTLQPQILEDEKLFFDILENINPEIFSKKINFQSLSSRPKTSIVLFPDWF